MPKTRAELIRENKVLIGAILILVLSLGIVIGSVVAYNLKQASDRICFSKRTIEEACFKKCHEFDGMFIRFNDTQNKCECVWAEELKRSFFVNVLE